MTRRLVLLALTAAFALTAVASSPSRRADSAQGSVLPNGWRVTPSGAITPLGTLPMHMLEDPSGHYLAITNSGWGKQQIVVVDEHSGSSHSLDEPSLFYGLVWSPNGNELYAGGAATGIVDVAVANGTPTACTSATCGGVSAWHDPTPHPWVTGLALSTDGKTLYATDGGANTLFAIDTATGTQRWAAKVGSQPYGVVLSADGKNVYVSNWAGGSVSVVDATTGALNATISICAHPNAELARPDGRSVYVACANENVIADIQTPDNTTRTPIQVGLYEKMPEGTTPNGLALSKDGATLFVADADENVVTAVNVAIDLPPVPGMGMMRPRPGVRGAVPAGYYTTDVAISRDSKQLFILDGKGVSGHANPQYGHESTLPWGRRPPGYSTWYVANIATGDLERLPYPSTGQLAAGLKQARLNSPYRPASAYMIHLPPIKHVIYIIKENRTYDEVLGDDPRGNGDPKLAIFGKHVTPNIHRLADDFVLLDNFYTESEVSPDGHNWATAAYATDYVQKLWPSSYSDRDRDYDFEQQGPASPSGGYIWDDVVKRGLSLRDYGEFVKFGARGALFPATPAASGLEGHVAPSYAGFDMAIMDQARVDAWLMEFRGYVTRGDLPAFEIMRLPCDHTSATRPGAHTPYAMVADNDYALGRIVDAVSHSRYWKDTLIFVTEDDAQAGPDHVSDQRAEALVAGAWIKRGDVDHAHYSISGMLHTMEVLLGLRPMSQFDAGGRLMFADFADKADLRPWTASKPLIDLNAVNARSAADAAQSARLDFNRPDVADPQLTTKILYDFVRTAHPR